MTEGNQVFLSTAHIAEWKAERERIAQEIRDEEAKIGPLRERLAAVDEKLRAAVLFVPELEDWLDREEEKQMGSEAVTLTDAIKVFLSRFGPTQPVARDMIRANLPSVGYDAAKLNANPNYLYTALKRLAARSEIVEGPPGAFKLKR